jgi:alcohol dehydrogenase class IV
VQNAQTFQPKENKMDLNQPVYTAEEYFEENTGTVICSGAGAFMQLSPLLHELGEATVLVCAGGENSFRKSGAFSVLQKVIGKDDINVPIFENIKPEPDTECVRNIVKVMEQEKPAAVIAIGGGSVMDAAKAAYISWQTGKDVKELFGSSVISKSFPDRTFRKVWCVPLTSGTGSEVTPYSNIIDQETGVKCLIADPVIIPEYAFLAPELTCGIPRKITVDTALDAMVHCVESYLNISAGKKYPEAAKWAVQGISMIVENLPMLLADNMQNPLLRANLSYAACLGGMCITLCPTSLPHLCSFSFCGKASHGAAVAALLPHFWRYYLSDPEITERTMQLSHIFHGSTPAEVVDSCEKFIASVGIETAPGTLAGLDLSFIDKLAENAALNPMKLASAPVPVDPGSAGKIFHQVLDPVWNS